MTPGQGALFRATDPETARLAAESVNTVAVETRILEAFDQFGWLSDPELVTVLDGYGPTLKTARSRLTGAGRLVDTGVRRPSERGRACIVWGLA